MTKAELIELLKDYPDDAIIMRQGHQDSYEGVTPVSDLFEITVKELTQETWEGTYIQKSVERPRRYEILNSKEIKAIFIS